MSALQNPGLNLGFLSRKPSSAWRTPHAARIVKTRKVWSALLECHLAQVKRASCLLANMARDKGRGMKNLRGLRGSKKQDARESHCDTRALEVSHLKFGWVGLGKHCVKNSQQRNNPGRPVTCSGLASLAFGWGLVSMARSRGPGLHPCKSDRPRHRTLAALVDPKRARSRRFWASNPINKSVSPRR